MTSRQSKIMEKKKNVKHRLPKGIQFSVQCQAVDFNDNVIETAENKSGLLSVMKERGYARWDYEIRWMVCDMTAEGVLLYNEGVGENRNEAVKDFWCHYN